MYFEHDLAITVCGSSVTAEAYCVLRRGLLQLIAAIPYF